MAKGQLARASRIVFGVEAGSGEPALPEILFKDGRELVICGVVTSAIKRFGA